VAKRLPAQPPVLAGYSYVRPLGVGGFADVFLFEQNMPRRQVAVKVLLRDIVDAELLRMFNIEADVMARLSAHPSIVTIYDASISSDGRPYLVMELCPDSMGTRYRTEQLAVDEVLTVGVKIASALATAHGAGLLHRDIKPANILFTTFGAPVLADFGIAGAIEPANDNDIIAMSVPWSAPEVIEERTSGTIATEVWALGATLYSLLAGRTPFEVDITGQNNREALASRIARARYTAIPRTDIPQALQEVLRTAMSRDPERRQRSMVDVATQLQRVQLELGVLPTPLEVASEEWTTKARALDFADETVRGPVLSTVPITSRRPARVARPMAHRAAQNDDSVFDAPAREPARGVNVAGLVIGASVVLILGVASVVAAFVLGGP
jgi:serine/threonine protein kinase